MNEVQSGLSNFEVKLSQEEIQLVIETLDENSDGVVSCEEFIASLDPPMKVQKEYKQIMGDCKVNNPIIFEERILDLQLRGKLL